MEDFKELALLPCPLCGGQVDLEKTVDGREWWGIVCRNTTNLGGSCAIQIRPSASKEAAVERWNCRAELQKDAEPCAEVGSYEILKAASIPWAHLPVGTKLYTRPQPKAATVPEEIHRSALIDFIDKYCCGNSALVACAEAAFYAFNQSLSAAPSLPAQSSIDHEAIPKGVYFGGSGDTFYDCRNDFGMGNGFHKKWFARRNEFPTSARDCSLPAQSTNDGFRGDNVQLCASIESLLELDAAGALVPHGVGGHARGLLSAAASRLRALPAQSEGEQK